MSVVAVQVCMSWVTNPDNSMSCNQLGWQQTTLIPPDAASYIDLIISGGFSPQAFGIGFGGTMMVFVIGLSAGAIASILRRVR